jgi:hypothetical protein
MRLALLAARLGALVAVSALDVPAAVRAQEIPRRAVDASDVWSEPAPGLRYLHRTTTAPCHVHALLVDLDAPGVRVVATRYDERWSTVTELAQTRGAAAAINGGFWGAFQRPIGVAIGGAEPWPTSAPDPAVGLFAIDAAARGRIIAPGDPVDLDRLHDAVSGRPILVRDGDIAGDALDAFDTANQRQPRTAAGLADDRRTVVLVVVDGRQSSSRGMTLYELARLLIELGAEDAINLDGGGSSEMFVRAAGGVVNVPSRGRWEVAVDEALGTREERRTVAGREETYVRGVEREVMNHLAVIAPAPPAPKPLAFDSALAGTPPPELPAAARRAPPRPPLLRLGALREVVVPALWLSVPGVGGVAVYFAVRAVRSRRGATPRAPVPRGAAEALRARALHRWRGS